MLVYNSLHGTAPVYIADMCIRRSFDSEHYQLRSAVLGELVVTLAKKVTLGRRSYRTLWNASIVMERASAQAFLTFLFLLASFGVNSKRSCIARFIIFDCRSAFVMASSIDGAV